jgi:peptidyl-tRNA hydrolase
MSVTDAQAYLDTWSTGDSVDMWKTRAARAVVVQAEQIERLQNALNEIEDWGMNVLESMAGVGIILPDDMEPPA